MSQTQEHYERLAREEEKRAMWRPVKIVGGAIAGLLLLIYGSNLYNEISSSITLRANYEEYVRVLGDENHNGTLDTSEKIDVWKRMGLVPRIAKGDTIPPRVGISHLIKAVESYKEEGITAWYQDGKLSIYKNGEPIKSRRGN